MNSNVDDLSRLNEVREGTVLDALKRRYDEDIVFTDVGGRACAFVNPYKELSIYGSEFVSLYSSGAGKLPHLYSTLQNVWNEMINHQKPQNVIFSGISGSGKSTLVRHALSYLTHPSNDPSQSYLNSVLTQSMTVLHSFGNTEKHSCFGSYLKLHFNADSKYSLRTGSLQVYNLDKSVLRFNILHQLVDCGDQALLSKLGLGQSSDYSILQLGGKHAGKLEHTLTGLQKIGIHAKGQDNLLRVLGAILHLSNVIFLPDSNGKASIPALCLSLVESAAELLSLSPAELQYSLVYQTKTESERHHYTTLEAQHSLNSFLRDIYGRMFDLIVYKINQSLETSGKLTRASIRKSNVYESNKSKPLDLSIGLLEFNGYDDETTSYEGFIHNYCALRLEQTLYKEISRNEEVYIKSGLKYTSVIDPIDKSSLNRRIKQMEPNLLKIPPKFTIKEDLTTYNALEFLSNNTNTSQDIKIVLKRSNNLFLQSLYPEQISLNTIPSLTINSKQEMDNLLKSLHHKTHIFTIKPNRTSSPNLFDTLFIQAQIPLLFIKYIHTAFTKHLTLTSFSRRYNILSSFSSPVKVVQDIDRRVEEAFGRSIGVISDKYVFIKGYEVYEFLEKRRKGKLEMYASVIQRLWGRCVSKGRFKVLKEDMIGLCKVFGKPLTIVDLLSPFVFVSIQEDSEFIYEVLDFYQVDELRQEKLFHSDVVKRVVRKTNGIEMEECQLVLTDQAFYVIKDRKLIRRTLLREITKISLSKSADDLFLISCTKDPKKKPINKNSIENPAFCAETGEKFSRFAKKGKCMYSGNTYSREFLRKQCLPDYGHYSPVLVHYSFVDKLSCEQREDVVISTDRKIQLASLFRELLDDVESIMLDQQITEEGLKEYQEKKKEGVFLKVLYDFTAQEADELDLVQGQIIKLVYKNDVDWWTGVTREGRTGLFASNYVEEVSVSELGKSRRKYRLEVMFTEGFNVFGAFPLGSSPDIDFVFEVDFSLKEIEYRQGQGIYKCLVPNGRGMSEDVVNVIMENRRQRLSLMRHRREEEMKQGRSKLKLKRKKKKNKKKGGVSKLRQEFFSTKMMLSSSLNLQGEGTWEIRRDQLSGQKFYVNQSGRTWNKPSSLVHD